jgi:hypothetical protein
MEEMQDCEWGEGLTSCHIKNIKYNEIFENGAVRALVDTVMNILIR